MINIYVIKTGETFINEFGEIRPKELKTCRKYIQFREDHFYHYFFLNETAFITTKEVIEDNKSVCREKFDQSKPHKGHKRERTPLAGNLTH